VEVLLHYRFMKVQTRHLEFNIWLIALCVGSL